MHDSIRLHIGGREKREGWLNLDVQPFAHVDIVGSIATSIPLPDGSVEEIYASHVLEHLGFQTEISAALHEIRRVLRRGGRFYVAVPDLDAITRLFSTPGRGVDEQLTLMAMIFGAQTDAYDFHKIGLNQAILSVYLLEAGFTTAQRVPNFGLFEDSSLLTFRGEPVSLNLIVT